ncbi:MAG: exodeoxyribonuclease VII small subunit [Gemmatimonadota bacterium]
MARPSKRTKSGGERLEPRLRRLDEIVAGLEREDLELEDALALFEEGVGHIRAAREVLERATQRVDQLLEIAASDEGAAP